MPVKSDAISFRKANFEKDAPFLLEVYGSTREEELKRVNWNDQQKLDFVAMQYQFQHKFYTDRWPEAQYMVILWKGKKVGRLYKDYRDSEIRIMDIAILAKYRRKGIGGRILQDILNEGADKQMNVTIHVEKNNPALKLYRQLGFRKVGEDQVYDLMEWSFASLDPSESKETDRALQSSVS